MTGISGHILVPSSELCAMQAEVKELRGTVSKLTSIVENFVHKMSAHHKHNHQVHEDGTSPLTANERMYKINRLEVCSILGISERTSYRKFTEIGLVSVKESGETKFILGDLVDIISVKGLRWKQKELAALLRRREIRVSRVYV